MFMRRAIRNNAADRLPRCLTELPYRRGIAQCIPTNHMCVVHALEAE